MTALRRLARMRPPEIRFRAIQAVRTSAEAASYGLGLARWDRRALQSRLALDVGGLSDVPALLRRGDVLEAENRLRARLRSRESCFPIAPGRRDEIASNIVAEFPRARAAAAARADRLLRGRFDLLGYRDLSFGDVGSIDWHLDPVHEKTAPRRFWRYVPYLDPRIGDHKIIWELNRHQHWLALGRAAWLTGDPRYTDQCVRQLHGWMAANPPLTGINWASMLELAFRSLSWLWALHFMLAFDREDSKSPWVVDLLVGLDRQMEQVADHLSVYFSPNTHLLGEALALYVAGQAMPELRGARRWSDLGRAVLLREIGAQIHPDGGHAELSAHYHRYALDFYMLALIVARRSGDGASASFEEVVSRMALFCRTLADDRGRLPLIGDDDGGMLFPICGREPADARDSLSLAASLLGRPALAAGAPSEETLWMLGGDRTRLARAGVDEPPASRAFADTGYAVLRSPGEHLVFDAGPHGFANGGHAHADALSVVLSAQDRPFLIDPGTATYTMDSALRNRFRSSAMHNTVMLDGRDQSEPSGPFHWRTRTGARLDVWRPGTAFDYAEAWHQGYAPTLHRRAILTTREGLWLIVDHILPAGEHDEHAVDLLWHLHPDWKTHRSDESCAQFLHRDGRWSAIAATVPVREHFHGDSAGLGWYAPVYGELIPAGTLRFGARAKGPTSFVTAVAAAASPQGLSIAHLPAASETPDRWHRVAATVAFGSARYVVLFATELGASGSTTGGERPPHRGVSRVFPGAPSATTTPGDPVLATDARVALLKVSDAGHAIALALVDGRSATWSGEPPVALSLPVAAADLHLDIAAQRTAQPCGRHTTAGVTNSCVE